MGQTAHGWLAAGRASCCSAAASPPAAAATTTTTTRATRRQRGADLEVRDRRPGEGQRLRLEPAGRRGAPSRSAGDLGIEVEVADGAGYEDISPILRELSTTDGAEFIVAQASGYNTTAPDVAAQTGVPELVWDNPEANDPGDLGQRRDGEPGGRLPRRACSPRTRPRAATLGIVISADDTNWNKQAGGFVAGARSVESRRRDRARPDRPGRLRRRRGRQARHRGGDRRRRRRRLRDGRRLVVRDAAGGRERPTGVSVHRRDRRQDRDRRPGRAALVGALGLRRALRGRDRRHRRRHVRRAGLRARPRERRHLAAPDRSDRRRDLERDRGHQAADHRRRGRGAADRGRSPRSRT